MQLSGPWLSGPPPAPLPVALLGPSRLSFPFSKMWVFQKLLPLLIPSKRIPSYGFKYHPPPMVLTLSSLFPTPGLSPEHQASLAICPADKWEGLSQQPHKSPCLPELPTLAAPSPNTEVSSGPGATHHPPGPLLRPKHQHLPPPSPISRTTDSY